MNGIPRRRTIVAVLLLLIVVGIVMVTLQSGLRSATTSNGSAIRTRPSAPPSVRTGGARRSQSAPNTRYFPEISEGADPEDLVRAERCTQEQRTQWLARREEIDPASTPEHAIAHAFLTQLLSSSSPDSGHAPGREFRAARYRWPQNLDVAWFSMQHCVDTQGCDRDAAWQHLQPLDPDNAVVWILAMQSARQRNDEAAYEQALQRAADSRRYDARFGAIFLHVKPLLLSVPMPVSCQSPAFASDLQELLGRPPRAEDWVDIHANAIEFAAGLPALGALSGCRDVKSSASRRRNCRILLARVADGDTFFEQLLALKLLVPLVDNGPGHVRMRERYRRLRWLQSVIPRLRLTDDFNARMWTEGEVAIWQSLAAAQGHWPPPPHWLPADARSRAFIQTGRVPPERRHLGKDGQRQVRLSWVQTPAAAPIAPAPAARSR